jgi:hypothetical protein
MTLRELISKIAKQEGKKHQAGIGDIREIIGIISDEIHKDIKVAKSLLMNGMRRAKRSKKKDT